MRDAGFVYEYCLRSVWIAANEPPHLPTYNVLEIPWIDSAMPGTALSLIQKCPKQRRVYKKQTNNEFSKFAQSWWVTNETIYTGLKYARKSRDAVCFFLIFSKHNSRSKVCCFAYYERAVVPYCSVIYIFLYSLV